MAVQLEHTNFTVSDPDATAAWMCDLFGWHVRWSGPGLTTGRTVHVGTDQTYLALFSFGGAEKSKEDHYRHIGGLNHVAVVVDDIDEMEASVKAQGFTPVNHGDYEPGRRFYFHDHDGCEYEVVSYT